MPQRRVAAAAFVAAFLVVQLAVPVVGLFRERPASFSWHMYSVFASLPDIRVVDPTGREELVDPSGLMVSRRAEVDYVPALLAFLCQRDDVASVRVSRTDQAPAEEVACE